MQNYKNAGQLTQHLQLIHDDIANAENQIKQDHN